MITEYLGAAEDVAAMRDRLPWRSDPVLNQAMLAFPHLRLLRQPLEETLLCFLCSATKQIPQIKKMCQNLADAFGSLLPGGYRALPTWEQLIEVDEQSLRECGLGFRAKNIRATALVLADHPDWARHIDALPYPEAKAWLMRLPGVGEKVADCALLFGAHKTNAFPVDTWILKTMTRHYGLQGWTNAQIAHFGRIHFGPFAGWAQQFLFAAERQNLLG